MGRVVGEFVQLIRRTLGFLDFVYVTILGWLAVRQVRERQGEGAQQRIVRNNKCVLENNLPLARWPGQTEQQATHGDDDENDHQDRQWECFNALAEEDDGQSNLADVHADEDVRHCPWEELAASVHLGLLLEDPQVQVLVDLIRDDGHDGPKAIDDGSDHHVHDDW